MCIVSFVLFLYPKGPKLTGCQPFYSGFLLEPFFQDGVIAQSANDVAELQGVPYFSSAGNQAKQSWEGTFKGSGVFDLFGCELHDFGGGDTRQSVFVNGGSATVFQWEDPFFSVSGAPGASRDMDFCVYFMGTIIAEDILDNIGGDPVAFISLQGMGTVEFEFSLCMSTPGASPPLMKWIDIGIVTNIEFDTQSSTSWGHTIQPFTAGVGAAFFQNTPAFGNGPSGIGVIL